MITLTNVCLVQEETKEVTSVEEGYDVERVVETTWSSWREIDDEMSSILWRCHRFNTSTELWTIPVVRGKRELPLSREACVLLKPVTFKLSWFHGVNSSSDSEGEVGIELTREQNGQGRDPRTLEQRRAVPTAGKSKEFTKLLSVTAETNQRQEWVQMFLKKFHRVNIWLRLGGPGKTSTQRRKVQMV